jgi:hypothetical protein
MLRLTPRLDVKGEYGGAQLGFTYRIKDRSWRIEDSINGGVINSGADGRRRIRFVKSDLTRESAGAARSMDLVVATHVLPYIKLYGGDQGKFGDALKNISRSMRRGGVLLTDDWSTDYLIKQEHPAWLRQMERTGREIVVAAPEMLRPLRSDSSLH